MYLQIKQEVKTVLIGNEVKFISGSEAQVLSGFFKYSFASFPRCLLLKAY